MKISFEYVDFYAKISLILDTPAKSSITQRILLNIIVSISLADMLTLYVYCNLQPSIYHWHNKNDKPSNSFPIWGRFLCNVYQSMNGRGTCKSREIVHQMHDKLLPRRKIFVVSILKPFFRNTRKGPSGQTSDRRDGGNSYLDSRIWGLRPHTLALRVGWS